MGISAFKERVWGILTPERHDHRPHLIGWFLLVLISANVAAVVLETLPELQPYSRAFHWFDVVSLVIFSIEYVFRVWSATADPAFQRPIMGRLRYMMTPLSIIDLVVIVPFYFSGVLTGDLRVLWALRLFRVFRILKMTRYFESLALIGIVVRKRFEALMVGFFICGVVLLVTATGIYVLEHDAQPEKFSSVPAALWWSSVTLTTTGYGDVVPVTPLGKTLGAVMTFIGIIMFALPASILTSGFIEEHNNRTRERCPVCRRVLPDDETRAEAKKKKGKLKKT